MKNKYEVRGDVTAIFIESPKYGSFEALVSTTHMDKLIDWNHKWSLKPVVGRRGTMYVHSFFYEQGEKKTVHLHSFILGTPSGMMVDHKNHNGLDNTDSNIRIVTIGQNNQNKNGAPINSSTGVRGVNYNKKFRKYQARVSLNRKSKSVGYFKTLEEAEQAVVRYRMIHMPFSLG